MLATRFYSTTPLSGRRACRSCATNAVASPSERLWSRDSFFGAKTKLPPVTFSTDVSAIDPVELADLFAQLATHAPSQAFHRAASTGFGQPSDVSHLTYPYPTNLRFDGSDAVQSTVSLEARRPVDLSARALAADRLQAALKRSTACIAAFVHEDHLPEYQNLGSRGMGAALFEQETAPAAASPSPSLPWWPLPLGGAAQRGRRQRRRVLVGFARAVSDRALVATLHDVAVMREMQGRGLGQQLLDRLTRQLLRLGIADVGLLSPTESVPFFERNNFGPDPEESITMVLSAAAGRERRRGQGGGGGGGDDRGDGWEFKPRPGLRELLLKEW